MKTETGAAGIVIELRDGKITVSHQDGRILAELDPAPEGTWAEIWASLYTLGFNRP